MIEFAPEVLDRINYDTAWLYCATLTYKNKYDWRIPTHDEYTRSAIISGWFENRQTDILWHCQPVRTKDD